NVDRNLVALGKANLFTTCDLLQGFHQVELTDAAKVKTAFITPWGQYAYTRMPMGLTSSPGTFMRLVDATLRGLPPGVALAFVDDIIIPTQGTIDDHLAQVGQVFDRLIEGGFTVRCDKVFVAMKEVKYLGFLVGAYGTRP
ncbi:RNA-directed DNA polymerase, partial [Staphylococcus aureus]|nr:RNA-directed DNA polymerase [Staphylococcus aureus]